MSTRNPPEWLTPDAKAYWQRLAPINSEAIGHPAMSVHFAQYCQFTANVCRLQIQTAGSETITNRFGIPEVNPLCDELHRQTAQMLRLAKQFGFTPLDSAKLEKVANGEDELEPLDI